ncbi:MAG: hypothetical protein EXS50_03220 [Candidatus Taylorbacteria bacterium]|nr:hypothetical protein [Candidatus Taylorbacteria bacterium]
MIYSIVGTNREVRERAYEELSKLGTVTTHIYSEQIATLEPLISATSLFGDKVIANLIQVMDVASSRDLLIDMMSKMKESENIFIIDEPFADANRVKRLEKFSKKIFNAREEKTKDVDVFMLCSLFTKRDKKNAWLEWMKIKELESPEAIHGALWWKFTTIWQDTRAGKPTKFTLKECEDFGGKLLRSSILSHRGERDLKVELEAIIFNL